MWAAHGTQVWPIGTLLGARRAPAPARTATERRRRRERTLVTSHGAQRRLAVTTEEHPLVRSTARADPAGLLRTLYLLSASERRLMRRQRSGLETMSPGRLHLLVHLLTEGEKTNGQLARYADLTPATITSMLDKLVEQGLVERRRDPDDRRVWWVSLTPHGIDETTAARQQWDRQFAAAFADATDAELEVARRILEKVVGVYDSI